MNFLVAGETIRVAAVFVTAPALVKRLMPWAPRSLYAVVKIFQVRCRDTAGFKDFPTHA